MGELLTTTEAARELGVHPTRVRVLIKQGRLRAAKVGRDWLIRPEDLEPVRHRPPGRRPKAPEATGG